MRVCPCPLLLVGDKVVSEPKVLACVNAEHGFNENQAVLSEAENLAGTSKKLLALYCWKFYGDEFMSEYVNEATRRRYVEEAEQNYRGIFNRFVAKHDLTAFGEGVRFENGDPAQLIPDFCRTESVDVVVLSSASQNHPLHLLLGSTVEAILDEIPCSLLVVKALGFKSPVKLIRSRVEIGNA